MKPYLLNDWQDYTTQQVLTEWFSNKVEVQDTDIEILLASYTYECYSGTAYVLYKDIENGNLYEVHGSHCSCYGLEDQWEPEQVTLEYLQNKIINKYVDKEYKKEFLEVFNNLKNETLLV
jgi:hypothetical protein